MSQPPPPLPNQPLNYATPIPRPPKPPIEHLWGKFFLGLLGGSGISALVWFLGPWNSRESEYFIPIFAVALPTIKLAAGVTFTCIRRFRPLGIGLLIAIPMGFLLFFFGCVSNLNFH